MLTGWLVVGCGWVSWLLRPATLHLHCTALHSVRLAALPIRRYRPPASKQAQHSGTDGRVLLSFSRPLGTDSRARDISGQMRAVSVSGQSGIQRNFPLARPLGTRGPCGSRQAQGITLRVRSMEVTTRKERVPFRYGVLRKVPRAGCGRAASLPILMKWCAQPVRFPTLHSCLSNNGLATHVFSYPISSLATCVISRLSRKLCSLPQPVFSLATRVCSLSSVWAHL